MVVYDKIRPLLKRQPVVFDTADDILRYDLDNIYPQRADEVLKRSYTLKAVVRKVSEFLYGEGFEDPVLASLVVNMRGRKGDTMNNVLMTVARQFAAWETIALHIGYDLNFRVSSITPIKVEYCRLGLPDSYGQVNEIKFSTNWEWDSRKEIKERTVTCYPIFDPTPETVQLQVKEAGGIYGYRGQILYWTPIPNEYPFATFDSVLDHGQTQGELGRFKVANVQNNFMSTLAVLYPGEFENQEDKKAFQDLIEGKSGAKNAGSRIGLQDKTGQKKVSEIFQSLTPVNLDRMFELTETQCVDAIMENEAMPKELLGVRPESGMFNQENMEQAYTYYNSATRPRRAAISSVFADLMQYWQTPIKTDAKIKMLQYTDTSVTAMPSTGGTEGDQEEPKQEEVAINENLKNLTGRQLQNIQRIVRNFTKGALSREQASAMLKSGYGFTDKDCDIWLITDETIQS